MNNASLQPVSPGQKVQADTINKIIQSTDFDLKTTGALTHIGKDINIQVLNQGQNDFSGQKFREPFDLSVSQTANGIQYTVLRPELYLWGSYRSIKNDLTVSFPTENEQHVGIYISCDAGCTPNSYGLAMMEADTEIHFADVTAPEGTSTQSRAASTGRPALTLKPKWNTTKGSLYEYWANGSSLKNPSWDQAGHSIREPSWRNGSSIENPSWEDDEHTIRLSWDSENTKEVLEQPGGATEADVTANNASDYDDTGDKYASSPHAWLIWSFMPNGTIIEDSRNMAIPAAEDMYFKATRPTKLDLSSLNWKVENPTDPILSAKYAQNFHYDAPRAEDLVDLKKVKADAQTSTADISCCVDKWRFLVRPEEGIGEGTLHYASLSDVLSAISSEGGGGECSCDLSVTPFATLSARGEDLIKIADWTKDNWQTHTEIYAPDSQLDINNLMARYALTPFSLQLVVDAVGQGVIRFNFFYYGRELKRINDFILQGAGTYYLHIQTNSYGYVAADIVKQNTESIPPNPPLENTDTDTYYLLWSIPNTPYTKTKGIPFDYRHMYHLPFYSN